MKNLLAIIAFSLTSASALAHGGGHSVICKSAAKSGSKQVVVFNLARPNGVGLAPPSFSVTVNGKKSNFTTEDEMKSFGTTFHNSPLGVITITADNSDEEKALRHGSFSLIAVPSTVMAYNAEGKLVKWTFNAEKDECNDANGKATFKGLFRGYMNEGEKSESVDLQIMDCELDYNSGMAC